MPKTELPSFLIEAMNQNNWWDLSSTCDWADAMFSKGEISIEVYQMVSHAGKPAVRLLATDDGETYRAANGIAWSREHVDRFFASLPEHWL